METNKLIAGIVAAAIAVIVLAGVLMPSLSNATDTHDTFTNEGYYRMSKTTGEYVITYNPSGDGASTIRVNGEKYDLASAILNHASRSLAFAEDYIIRMYHQSSYSIQLWSAAFVTGVDSSTFAGTLTITINNGSLTWHNSVTDVTTTYSYTGDMIAYNPAGDMILKKADDESYVLKDTTIIYGGGISLLTGSTYTGIYLEGTVEDYEVTVLNSNATVSNKSEVYTEVDEYKDLVKFEKFTFDTTYNDTVTHQTYSYVVVPYQVTAEKAVHLTDAMNVILNVIPLLIIVAVLLGVVAVFILRRE